MHAGLPRDLLARNLASMMNDWIRRYRFRGGLPTAIEVEAMVPNETTLDTAKAVAESMLETYRAATGHRPVIRVQAEAVLQFVVEELARVRASRQAADLAVVAARLEIAFGQRCIAKPAPQRETAADALEAHLERRMGAAFSFGELGRVEAFRDEMSQALEAIGDPSPDSWRWEECAEARLRASAGLPDPAVRHAVVRGGSEFFRIINKYFAQASDWCDDARMREAVRQAGPITRRMTQEELLAWNDLEPPDDYGFYDDSETVDPSDGVDPESAKGDCLEDERVREEEGLENRPFRGRADPPPGVDSHATRDMLPTIDRAAAYRELPALKSLAEHEQSFLNKCDRARPGEFLSFFKRPEFKGANGRTYRHVAEAMAKVAAICQKAAAEAAVVDPDEVNRVLATLGLPALEGRAMLEFIGGI